jgi:hypothetical protein
MCACKETDMRESLNDSTFVGREGQGSRGETCYVMLNEHPISSLPECGVYHVHCFNKCIFLSTQFRNRGYPFIQINIMYCQWWVPLVTITYKTTNYYHMFIVTENLLMMALWVIQQNEGSTKFWRGFHPKETFNLIVSWILFTSSVEYYGHWCYFEHNT